MKVVFIDIDGVLNNHKCWNVLKSAWGEPMPAIDRVCVKRLNRLLRYSGAVLVMSSSWRHGSDASFDRLTDWLQQHAGLVGRFVGRTDSGQGCAWTRGNQIVQWVEQHPEITDWVALDDDLLDSTLGDIQSHAIQTSAETGLRDVDVEKALRILGV